MFTKIAMTRFLCFMLTITAVSVANATNGDLLHQALTNSFRDHDDASDQRRRNLREDRQQAQEPIDDPAIQLEMGNGVQGLTRYIPETTTFEPIVEQ